MKEHKMKTINKILEICEILFIMPFASIYLYICVRHMEKEGL